MQGYIVTERALAQLEAMIRYIAERNFTAAKNVNKSIFEAFDFLAQNPKAGRERPELSGDYRYRFWVVMNNYLIAYTDGDIVTIHAIFHSARDIPHLL